MSKSKKEKSVKSEDTEKKVVEKKTASGIGQAAQLKRLQMQTLRAIAIGIVLLVLSIVSNLLMSSAQSTQLEVTMALNQYRLGSKALTAAVQSYAVEGNKDYYDAYMKELNEDKNRDKALEVLKKKGLTDDEWAGLNNIAELSDGLVPLEESAMKAVQGGDKEKAQSYVFSAEYEETVQKINLLTDEVINQIQDREAQEKNMFSILQILCQIVFVISLLYVIKQIMKIIKFSYSELLTPIQKVSEQMVVLADGNFSQELDLKEDESEVGTMVTAISFMKNNMHNMIAEISDILDAMGGGNYTFTIQKEYVGEFTQIKESFLQIGERMRETLHTLRNVTEQIDSGSEQLACAAQDLAEGSTSQATQISELMEVIKGMSVAMDENATEARESVELSTKAGETLNLGNEKMQELKNAISEISKCSEQIGTIIATIEDIASQTNLLSLNAAIEAARAGEAGKGFAVVAEQVKNLAEESAAAAGRTRKLIETTIFSVDKGIQIADETVENMGEVMQDAKAATVKMAQISEMLGEHVENMHSLTSTIESVSQVVDNNSATSEETAAVSEQQKAQVETMVDLVDQFQI